MHKNKKINKKIIAFVAPPGLATVHVDDPMTNTAAWHESIANLYNNNGQNTANNETQNG